MTRIGDTIIPTYIDDEWLAQYVGMKLEVIDIHVTFYDNMDRGIVTVRHFNEDGKVNEFNLFTGIDKWKTLRS